MNIPIGLSLSPFFPQSFSHRPDDGHGMTAALNPPALMEGNGIRSPFDLLIISAEMIISVLTIL